MNKADSMPNSEPQFPSHLKGIDRDSVNWKEKDDDYWREKLSPEQYQVCRKGGTERPFSGAYCQSSGRGTFICSSCGLELFSSESKFDSGTGWPSFTETAREGAIEYLPDRSHGMQRTEVRCSRCGSHLGHVFDDGPPPTGKRYCINSLCLYKLKEGER